MREEYRSRWSTRVCRNVRSAGFAVFARWSRRLFAVSISSAYRKSKISSGGLPLGCHARGSNKSAAASSMIRWKRLLLQPGPLRFCAGSASEGTDRFYSAGARTRVRKKFWRVFSSDSARNSPSCFLIVAARHAERTADIRRALQELGLAVALRSRRKSSRRNYASRLHAPRIRQAKPAGLVRHGHGGVRWKKPDHARRAKSPSSRFLRATDRSSSARTWRIFFRSPDV